MPGLYTGANGLWGGFAGLLYGSTSLSTPPGLLADAAAGFSPASLFANGEQGVWLDNSDFTTLFQDAAGTTPVTGYEQFVGLRLDKSKSGVGTNGAKRVNLLSWTEAFDNAAWTKTLSTISANQTTAPDGTSTADTFVGNASSTTPSIGFANISFVSGVAYTLSVYAKSFGYSFLLVAFTTEAFPDNNRVAVFDIGNGAVGSATQSGTNAAITPVGNGWYRCSITVTADATAAASVAFGPRPNDAITGTSQNGTSGIYIWGADLRLASEAATLPTYQRITDTWYNTIPGNHAYQTTTTARAVLSARYNLLTYTEGFPASDWLKLNVGSGNVLADQTVAPDGTLTADKLVVNTTNGAHGVYRGTTVSANTANRSSIAAKAAELSWVLISDTQGNGCYFNIGTGAVGSTLGNGSNASIVNLGNGWYRCSVQTGPLANSSYGVYVANGDGGVSFAGANTTDGIFIWGADLRVANESSALPAYQRVGAAVNGTSTSIGTPDYDTVGFPAYLRYDGGDWYQTSSIDFSTGATNPPLGPELVTNGDFSGGTTGWAALSNTAGSAVIPTISVVDGALQTTYTGAPNVCGAYSTITTVIGRWYRVSVLARHVSGSDRVALLRIGTGTGSDLSGYTLVSGFPGTSNSSFTQLTAYFVATATSTSILLLSGGTGTSGTFTDQYDNVSVRELTDANYAPDKMSVFAGVRKIGTSTAVFAELSADANVNNGSFYLVTDDFSYGYATRCRGTANNGTAYSPYASPRTDITSMALTTNASLATNAISFRVNAETLVPTASTSASSTGNFGNYPLYIGSRGAGTGLFFNGREYETIVLGRAVTATELTNTEGYMETQTFGKDMSYVYSDELTTATGDLITAADGDQIYMTVQYV